MLKSLAVPAGLVLVFCVTSPVSAQIFFEPVQYQYGANPTFYYGGTDPRVFEYALRTVYGDGIAGPQGGRYFVGNTYRGPIGQPPAVFSDRVPHSNAALFGYTPADARNDANAGLPTYFRKIDLLRAAVPSGDGKTLVVPAQAPLPPAVPYMDIRPYHRPFALPGGGPSTRPSTEPAPAPAGPSSQPNAGPQPLLIIPKSLVQPPAPTPAPATGPSVVMSVTTTR